MIVLSCETDTRRFVIPETCKSRVCPECQRRHANKYRRRFTKMVGAWKRRPGQAVMLLTLTFRATGALITGAEIRRGFREVRRLVREFYPNGDNCGAVGVAEIGQGNNLHVHLIVVGGYVSQRHLSERWLKITGNSYVVDIRAVRQVGRAVGYVLKYIGKLPSFVDPVSYGDLLAALKGTRRLHTFGCFYNRMGKPETSKFECPFCGGKLRFHGESDEWNGQASYLWWSKRLRSPNEIPVHLWTMLQATVGLSNGPDWAWPESLQPGFLFPLT